MKTGWNRHARAATHPVHFAVVAGANHIEELEKPTGLLQDRDRSKYRQQAGGMWWDASDSLMA